MNISDVVMAVRQRWWVVLLCLVLGGGAGLGFAAAPAPTYSSMARVVVAVPDVEQNSLQLPGGLSAAQRATNYSTLATSTEVLQGVITDLGLHTSVNALSRTIQVDIPIGTTVVQITATAGTAAGAQQVAESVAEHLSATADRLETALGVSNAKVVLSVADPAPLPASADPAGTLSKTALGLIAGLIAGAGVLWLLEYLDGSIRRPEDLADVTAAPVLGSVARAHSGDVPAAGAAAESFRTIRAALGSPRVGSTVLVVAGVGDNDASAPVAANLAAIHSRAGRSTVLIDANLDTAALGTLLGIPRGTGLAEALPGSAPAIPAMSRWQAGGTDVVAAGVDGGGTDFLQGSRLTEIFEALRGEYDVIIVDAPAAQSSVDAAALGAAADGVILVATWGKTSLAAAKHARDRVTMRSAALAGSVLVDVPRYRRNADFVPAPR